MDSKASRAPDIRKILYTTNAIESVNMGLRKVIKNRRHFPSDEAAMELIYLALQNMMAKWTKPPVCLGGRIESICDHL